MIKIIDTILTWIMWPLSVSLLVVIWLLSLPPMVLVWMFRIIRDRKPIKTTMRMKWLNYWRNGFLGDGGIWELFVRVVVYPFN